MSFVVVCVSLFQLPPLLYMYNCRHRKVCEFVIVPCWLILLYVFFDLGNPINKGNQPDRSLPLQGLNDLGNEAVSNARFRSFGIVKGNLELGKSSNDSFLLVGLE